MKRITITLLLLAPIAVFAQVVNLEDDGANVQNSTSGTGYFQWENTKLDEGILYADSAEIEEELVVRDSTLIDIIEAHSTLNANLEDNGANVQNSTSGTGYFQWENIRLHEDKIGYNGNDLLDLNTSQVLPATGTVALGAQDNRFFGTYSTVVNIGQSSSNKMNLQGLFSGSRTATFPDKSGTVAFTNDLLVNIEDTGTGVKNSTGGTGYFQWQNVGINSSTIYGLSGNLTLESLSGQTQSNSEFVPGVDNTYDLGTSSLHWKDLYLEGDIYTDDRQLAINDTLIQDYIAHYSSGGGGDITYNTYTPTFSDQVNIASNTLINAYYLRSGNFVQVYVMNEWEASTNGPISFDISLPLATEINDSSELIGNGCIRIAANSATNSIQIFGNADDDEATFKCYGNASISFVTTSSFSYIIQETEMMSPSSRFSDFNSSIENKSNSTDVEENDLSIPDFGKRDIEPDVPGLQFINKLEPVSYEADYNLLNNSVIQQSESLEDFRRFGLVSSDVERVIRENGYNFNITENKQSEIIRYEELVMPLIKSVQELNALVESQKEDINSLKELVSGLPINLKNNPMKGSGSNIEQNVPNPFDYETEINMYVNHSFHKAEINIYDLKGSFIKSVPISGRGNTSVKLSSFDLDAGIYLYSLIADEQVVETKRMIINK